MKNIYLNRLMIFVAFVLSQIIINAQEFPVAVGSDTTFSGGAVYGGLNGIVAVQGNVNSQYTINVQIVAAGGVLVGPRIFLESAGMMPGAIPVFDGTNYFLVWREFNGNLKGQFLNTLGNLVGSHVTISTNVSVQRPGSFGVIFADNEYFVVFTKTDNILYGQRVSTGGNLIGSQIQISNNLARDVSLSYDGTNYLVTWVEIIPDTDKDIYGQFIGKTGSLVGNNFLIDGGPNYSDNPTSLAFDGIRYLLVFHEQVPGGENWSILGRFISTSGAIEETITICDTTKSPFFPSVAFDNTNYLITWAQLSDRTFMGRFYNTSGVPVDSPFEIFGQLGDKKPIGGVGFGGGLYLAVATRVDSNFTDGDVYARFISPLTSVEEENNFIPEKFALYQNYPNPFNPSTTIEYVIASDKGAKQSVLLKIYDMLGNEVTTLVNEYKSPGKYKVTFDASNLVSGVYLYRLILTNNSTKKNYMNTKKLILLK